MATEDGVDQMSTGIESIKFDLPDRVVQQLEEHPEQPVLIRKGNKIWAVIMRTDARTLANASLSDEDRAAIKYAIDHPEEGLTPDEFFASLPDEERERISPLG